MYKTTYAFVILYIVTITFAKMSILLFYRRVFGASIIWYIVFVLACLHGAEVRITWLCGCRPVSYFWESYTDPDAVGSCIDDPLFWFITRLIGLFIDIAVLLVPVPISKPPAARSSGIR